MASGVLRRAGKDNGREDDDDVRGATSGSMLLAYSTAPQMDLDIPPEGGNYKISARSA
jgi:hypothetical protein